MPDPPSGGSGVRVAGVAPACRIRLVVVETEGDAASVMAAIDALAAALAERPR